MLWKERYVSRTSGVLKITVGLVFVIIVIILGYATYQFAAPAFVELWEHGYTASGAYSDRSGFNVYLRGMTITLYIAWVLGIASAASAGVVSEREADTWTSLTATPLGGEEILRAKMFGATWGTRTLGLLLLVLWLLGLASGAVHPLGFAAASIVTAVFIGYVAALGTFLSLISRTSARAQAATMAILMITNWAYLLCCIPMRVDDTALMLVGVTPVIEGGSLLSYEDISRMFNSPDRARVWEALLAGFLSAGLHGAAALILTWRSFATFDAKIDRPHRRGYQAAEPGKKEEADIDQDDA
jgi:ABC-type Na+ efflux pump permease subunit